MGRIIPVAIRPNKPGSQEVPEAAPMDGGKIKFPAPKNVANSAKPTIILSLVISFFSFI